MVRRLRIDRRSRHWRAVPSRDYEYLRCRKSRRPRGVWQGETRRRMRALLVMNLQTENGCLERAIIACAHRAVYWGREVGSVLKFNSSLRRLCDLGVSAVNKGLKALTAE